MIPEGWSKVKELMNQTNVNMCKSEKKKNLYK